MHRKYKLVVLALIILGIVVACAIFFQNHNIVILSPSGLIGRREQQLIVFAVLLSLLVVLPVFALTIYIAWKYREGNTKAKYRPEWDHNNLMEAAWWVIPFVIIFILSIVAWNSSHHLDPFKPLANSTKSLTIQVVALDWKWLFIYPKQNIATVNFIEFPVNTPLNFQITSDSVMNSFWLPSLGGQIYAMPGMTTQLHLMGNEVGNYTGSSANISGTGFSGMTFNARVTSLNEFGAWAQKVQSSKNILTPSEYNKLAQPSQDNLATYYFYPQQNLFDTIVNKYMTPSIAIDQNNSSAAQSAANAESLYLSRTGKQ